MADLKQAKEVELNMDWVNTLRKDFLLLMRNVEKVSNFDEAETLRQAFNVFRKRFDDLFFQEFMNRHLKYQMHLDTDRAKQADDYIRETAWAFEMSLQLPLDSWEVTDGKVSKEMCFANFQRRSPKWETATRKKAQAFWKRMREMIELYGGAAQKFDSEVADTEVVEIEGFRCEIHSFRVRPEKMEVIKEGLRQYRERAQKYLPILLAYQTPITFDFASHTIDLGGEYKDGHVFLYPINITSPSVLANFLAHEMGHHLWKVLSSEVTNSWYQTINGDFGSLDVKHLVEHWPGDAWTFQFGRVMGEKDPTLALQVEALSHDRSYPELNTKADFQKLLDSGETILKVPNTPITGYANKNPQEAFCEAIGMLIGYGPRAVHERVRHWLDWVLPETSKTASLAGGSSMTDIEADEADVITLYHATYRPLLKSIQTKGLGNTKRKNWEDSKSGVVYLANNPDIAESYAETAEDVPESWLDKIVILKVKVPKSSLKTDENVLDGGDTFEYHGVIPWAWITFVSKSDQIKTAESQVHSFGCVMIRPKAHTAELVRKLGTLLIKDHEVYTDPEDPSYGLEQDPHVTCLWGIKPTKVGDRVAKVAQEHAPSHFRLGNVSLFPAEGDTPYDVVKFDVDMEGLKEFHDALLEEFPDTEETYDYHPHMTLGYVKAGFGEKVLARVGKWQGKTVEAESVTYSRQDGELEVIELQTQKVASAAPAFPGSKIVDKEGNPLICYHGTSAEFEEFDIPENGVAYFTPDPNYGHIKHSPITVPVYLNIQNPYYTDYQSDVEGAGSWPDWIADLKAQGYDGIVYAKPGDLTRGPLGWGDDRSQIVAFYPQQIKRVEATTKIAAPVNVPQDVVTSLSALAIRLLQQGGGYVPIPSSSWGPLRRVSYLDIRFHACGGHASVQNAHVSLEGRYIFLDVHGDPSFDADFTMKDIQSALVHELSHLAQADFQGPSAFLRSEERGNLSSTESNHEIKAVSTEMCHTYRQLLLSQPYITPEEFIQHDWRWKQIKKQTTPEGWRQILRDCASVWRDHQNHKLSTARRIQSGGGRCTGVYVESQEVGHTTHKEAYSGADKERSIWYHGTSTKNLRSILSQGLIPPTRAEDMNWGSDGDASINSPDRTSYGGIYLTRNLRVARNASRERRKPTLIVCCTIQPRSLTLDEDDIVNSLFLHPMGAISQSEYSAPAYYIAATQPDPNTHMLVTAEGMKATFTSECLEKLKQRLGDRLHPSLVARLETLLGEAWLPAVGRNVAHLMAKAKDYEKARAFREGVRDRDTEMPADAFPTISEAESAFRRAVDPITRTLKSLARPEVHKNDFRATARVMEPITYSGSNRIMCVVEIGLQPQDAEGHTDYSQPYPLTVHYGELPEDFLEQWQMDGGSYVLRKPGETEKTAGFTLPTVAVKLTGRWLDKTPSEPKLGGQEVADDQTEESTQGTGIRPHDGGRNSAEQERIHKIYRQPGAGKSRLCAYRTRTQSHSQEIPWFRGTIKAFIESYSPGKYTHYRIQGDLLTLYEPARSAELCLKEEGGDLYVHREWGQYERKMPVDALPFSTEVEGKTSSLKTASRSLSFENVDHIQVAAAAYRHKMISSKKLFPRLSTHPFLCYYFADHLGRPVPELEDVIAKDPSYSFNYAKHVLKPLGINRFEKGEPGIARQGHKAMEYALDVLEGPFPAGEDAIILQGGGPMCVRYAEEVLKGPFPEGEREIAHAYKGAGWPRHYLKYLESIGKEPAHPELFKEAEKNHQASGGIGSGPNAMTTHGKFWGRAGAGCVFIARDTGRVLLAYRSLSVNEPHTWGVWGGALHEDETPLQGAQREAHEETGYRGPIEFEQAYVYTNGDFQYTTFVAWVPTEFTPTLNWETEEFRWCAVKEWPRKLHFGLKACQDVIRERQLDMGNRKQSSGRKTA